MLGGFYKKNKKNLHTKINIKVKILYNAKNQPPHPFYLNYSTV
jgi:hypothetical protein